MQKQQQLTKEELQTWKSQLKVVQLEDKYVEEALELVVESTIQLYVIFQELGITKEQCREAFRSDFEDKLNQKNSILVTDPSNNNKIIGIRIFRDLVNIDQTPPKREDYKNENYFVKSQLNHQLMEGVYQKEFKELDYEISIIFNVHPEYANRGLSEWMIALYVEHAYRRGVKNFVNIIFSQIMLKVLSRIKSSNPTVLMEVNLEDYELEGKKVFKEQKNGFLLSQELNDETVAVFGHKKLVELKQKEGLELDEQQFYTQ